MAAPTVHVHPGHHCRLVGWGIPCAVRMLMVAEVRHRTLRFMAAVWGRPRPHCLERYQDKEEDQNPAAHSWADSMPTFQEIGGCEAATGLQTCNPAKQPATCGRGARADRGRPDCDPRAGDGLPAVHPRELTEPRQTSYLDLCVLRSSENWHILQAQRPPAAV